MPESVLRFNAPLNARERRLDDARKRLIEALPPYRVHGPVHASTCYIWPSSECPVGCGHCNYAAPLSVGAARPYTVARDPEPILTVMNQMGLWKAVLSGGGEPMVEPEFCETFVRQIDSPQLEEIELITAAHFADTRKNTQAGIRSLVGAWRARDASLAPASFTIRISLDWFHAERIGVEPAANVISALGHEEFRDVGCYIRSVLLDNDQTIEQLAASLGAELSELVDYQRTIHLPDGRDVLIYFKNLIIDGRLTESRLERLPVAIPEASRAEEFGMRFKDSTGHHVPARVYNGPEVRHLDGLAMLIEDDGQIRILEGNDPNRCADIRQHRTWEEAITYLYRDPLTVFLVDNGPEGLARTMADRFPDSVRVATDTNQLYHLTEFLLATPERRLFATLAVLEQHRRAGRIDVDETIIAAYRDELDR